MATQPHTKRLSSARVPQRTLQRLKQCPSCLYDFDCIDVTRCLHTNCFAGPYGPFQRERLSSAGASRISNSTAGPVGNSSSSSSMLGYLPRQMPALLSALGQRLSEALEGGELQQQEAAVLQECLQVRCCFCVGCSVMQTDAYLMGVAATGGSNTAVVLTGRAQPA
jgi:hypothetical protein